MAAGNPPKLVPLPNYREYSPPEMARRARELAADLRRRRSVREFSSRPVEREVIEQCLATAVSAPSGANRQPWHFVAVSDPEIKRRIRLAAEEEEREFYGRRAPQEWLEALAPIGTDEHKPFLETAPYLIAVFALAWGYDEAGDRVKHYYVSESVGIAVGLLIAALHNAGLVCLTHTPSPMRFLREILLRPEHERPYLLLPVGYPAEDAQVPDLARKPIEEVVSFR
jgi:nitroreductase